MLSECVFVYVGLKHDWAGLERSFLVNCLFKQYEWVMEVT